MALIYYTFQEVDETRLVLNLIGVKQQKYCTGWLRNRLVVNFQLSHHATCVHSCRYTKEQLRMCELVEGQYLYRSCRIL